LGALLAPLAAAKEEEHDRAAPVIGKFVPLAIGARERKGRRWLAGDRSG
jgi:hypothetical protein